VTDPVIISDPLRVPITAERRNGSGVVLRGHFRGMLALSQSECERLASFITGKAHIRRYPVEAPESTQTGE
jgi:hypothetical protein